MRRKAPPNTNMRLFRKSPSAFSAGEVMYLFPDDAANILSFYHWQRTANPGRYMITACLGLQDWCDGFVFSASTSTISRIVLVIKCDHEVYRLAGPLEMQLIIRERDI